MFMNKYYLLFLVFINFNVSGQNNTQLWTRINIISNINKNWSFSNEFNIRMQSQNNTITNNAKKREKNNKNKK